MPLPTSQAGRFEGEEARRRLSLRISVPADSFSLCLSLSSRVARQGFGTIVLVCGRDTAHTGEGGTSSILLLAFSSDVTATFKY